MMSLQDYKNTQDIKYLIAKLFECRQVANNVHLQTKSYSQHKALGAFYENLLVFTDDLVEAYQGQHGIVNGYEKLIQIDAVKDVVAYLEDCAKIFNVAKDNLKDSHLKNIMEEIIALTYKTIYMTKNLS